MGFSSLLALSLILGPGTFSYAGDGILERVAERRLQNQWGLSGNLDYDVLIAPADCDLLNKTGWLVTQYKVMTVKVVDCEQDNHKGQMDKRGLLADTNRVELTHEKGWVVLR